MMIVAKFGGSSLANAGQIKKVAAIIQGKPEIKAVVVSAPGKRFAEDIKATKLRPSCRLSQWLRPVKRC